MNEVNGVSGVVMRSQFIDRAKLQVAEIDQYFADVEHWNSTRTRFEQVVADPDGKMARLRAGLAAMIDGA